MKDLMTDDAAIHWHGVYYKTILSSEDSGGTMSIVDSLSPVDSGPPRHIHHNEDETFVILTGACRLWLEGVETVLHAGQSAFVPRGSEHTFKVIGEAPSRHLVILTPGGFERFFAEMAAGQFAVTEDMPAIVEAGRRHHLTFTGPPLD
ncbi:cupin domain-containing protein [Mameliella alba]|nr:cupin domain-containing protein [Antarctobacter heliothermus]MBY6144158.1 cupin domain-containing protein [Mameliella alba]MCA0954207.1 cupin domain-containing protein [Mameliella alba]